MNSVDGALILDKPPGITSFDAVRLVRRLAGVRKVGHIGTLDPLGTGVLPMLLGRATRLARFYLGHRREYVATVRFGWATNTYDADGTPLGPSQEVALEPAGLEAALDEFRGDILQTPPQVSAKKVGGVRSYALARRNRPARLDPVLVTIHELEVLGLDGSAARLRCLCSSGTYIRALAHDLGLRLGCGAHVEALRRTMVGDFRLDDSIRPGRLEALCDKDRIGEVLLPPRDLLPEIPCEYVGENRASLIRYGRDFHVNPFGPLRDAALVKVVSPTGHLLCLGRAVSPGLFHPMVVFH